MNYSTHLKLVCVSAMIALLAACGGGDAAAPGGGGGTPDKPLPEVPWGSPAVFVTPGQTSASFALSGCYLENELVGDSGDLYQAKLVVSSEGDVSIVGTLSELSTATAATLLSMKFADVTLSNWGVSGTIETPTYSLHMMKLGRTPDSGNVELGVNYQGLNDESPNEGVFAYDNALGKYIYDCALDTPLALKTLINEARVAKHMAQGVAAVDDFLINYGYFSPESPAPSGVEGDVIFWSLPAIEELPQQNFRFNSQTGALLTSIGTDTSATMTTISFALPSAGSESSGGIYSESTCRNMQLYEFKEAKTLIAANGNGFENALIATRYGDKLMPISFISLLRFIGGEQEWRDDLAIDGAPDCMRPRFNNDFDR